MRSMQTARDEANRLHTPLYLLPARGDVVRMENEAKLTQSVHADLLHLVNLEATKSLPSFLPLYIGMRVLLSSKDCVRIGIMKGCPYIVEHIVLADGEVAPVPMVAGVPRQLTYMPVSLIIRA